MTVKSGLAKNTKLVLRELLTNPKHAMSRQEILKKYWGKIDALELDRVLKVLKETAKITIEQAKKSPIYIAKKKTLDQYTKYKQEIN